MVPNQKANGPDVEFTRLGILHRQLSRSNCPCDLHMTQVVQKAEIELATTVQLLWQLVSDWLHIVITVLSQ